MAGSRTVPEAVIVRRDTWAQMLALVRTSWDTPAVREMFVSAMFSDMDPVGRGVFCEFLRISAEGPQVADLFSATMLEDVSELARAVRAPTLVMHGDRDVTIPIAYGVRLAALIPGARFEILTGASHMSNDPRAAKLALEFFGSTGQ